MIEVKNLVRTFKSGDRTIKPVNDVKPRRSPSSGVHNPGPPPPG